MGPVLYCREYVRKSRDRRGSLTRPPPPTTVSFCHHGPSSCWSWPRRRRQFIINPGLHAATLLAETKRDKSHVSAPWTRRQLTQKRPPARTVRASRPVTKYFPQAEKRRQCLSELNSARICASTAASAWETLFLPGSIIVASKRRSLPRAYHVVGTGDVATSIQPRQSTVGYDGSLPWNGLRGPSQGRERGFASHGCPPRRPWELQLLFLLPNSHPYFLPTAEQTWYLHAVPGVPRHIMDPFTQQLISPSDFIYDGSASQWARPPPPPPPSTGRATWLLAFLRQVTPFRVFSLPTACRVVDKNGRTDFHSGGCLGYCSGILQTPYYLTCCDFGILLHRGLSMLPFVHSYARTFNKSNSRYTISVFTPGAVFVWRSQV